MNPKQNKSWQEEFDDKFIKMLQCLYGGEEQEKEAKEIIKLFIQSLISQARKEEREEMVKKVENTPIEKAHTYASKATKRFFETL